MADVDRFFAGFNFGSTLVCAQTKQGPNCMDRRKERAQAEQDDCLKMGMLEYIQEVWNCRQTKTTYIPSGSAPSLNPWYIDDIDCYGSSQFSFWMSRCYCTGLTGLTCTTCPKTFPNPPAPTPNSPPPPDVPPTVFNPASVTISETGEVIPIAYGRVRVAGNIIWTSEARRGNSELSNVIDMAVGLVEGEIDEVVRMWIGEELVIDRTVSDLESFLVAASGMTVTIHRGSEAQRVDKRFPETWGKVPAYRGLAYVFIKNYPLLGNDGQMPAVKFEIVSRAEQGVATWVDSDVTIQGSSFCADQVNGRLIGADASGDLVTATAQDIEDETVFDVGTIRPTTLSYTRDRSDIVFQDTSNNITWMSGADRRTVTFPTSAQAQRLVGYTVPNGQKADQRLFFGTFNNEMRLYKLNERDGESLVFAATNPNVSSFSHVFFDLFGTRVYAYAAAASSSGIYIHRWLARNSNYASYYDDARPIEGAFVTFATLGCTSGSPTLINILHAKDKDGFVIFMQDGAVKRAALITSTAIGAPTWRVQVAAAPTGRLGSTRTSKYGFIQGDDVYTMNLDDGSMSLVGYKLSENSAPALGAAQTYDAQFGTILYASSSGYMAKVYPTRYTNADVTLQDVFTDLAKKAGLNSQQYNFAALSSLTVDGYLITEQDSTFACYEELGLFYHLAVVESSRGVTATPLSLAEEYELDVDDYSQGFTRTRRIGDYDSTQYVRVSYLDTTQDYQAFYQEVSRDFLRGDDEIDNTGLGVEYGIQLFTTPTPVKRSAELTLMRRLQNTENFEYVLAPRYLAIDPVDFITVNGVTQRVTSTTLSPELTMEVVTVRDDISVYADAPALEGVSYNPLLVSMSSPETLTNIPIALNVPVMQNGSTAERIYFGQVNPEAQTFRAARQFYKYPGGTYQELSAARDELQMGHLVQGPNEAPINTYSFQRDNTVIIEFSKDVSASQFATVDKEALNISEQINVLLVGNELIQFTDFEIDNDNRTVTFTGLYRGRFATPTTRHIIGERCVHLTATNAVIQRVPDQSVTVALITTAVYDPAYSGFARETDYSFAPIVKTTWFTTEPLWRSRVNFFDDREFAVKVPPQKPYTYEMPDEVNPAVPFYEGTQAFVLEAPFDYETFQAKYAEGGWMRNSGEFVSSNDYIRRRLAYPDPLPQFATSLTENIYADVAVAADGVAHSTGDQLQKETIYLAVMIKDRPLTARGFRKPVDSPPLPDTDEYSELLW